LSDVSDPELEDLLRQIDALVAQRDWDGLLALRDRARAAHERGKQHWPAASHAEYRLALEAPGAYAGAVIAEGAGRFALGPLAEVAASTHRWEELDPHVPGGPLRTIAVHECVVRADLTAYDKGDPHVLPVALSLQSWEPMYPVATYRPDKADFPLPALPELAEVELPPAPPESSPDVDEALALRGLASTWVSESNGRARSVGVRGGATTAIAALDVVRARVAPLSSTDAMALMAWVAASGGAEGRRRGMAWGRFAAWECAAVLAGVEIEEVGDVIDDLNWYMWDASTHTTGWALRLAVEDPDNDVAWAVEATDQVNTRSR
jgi:hypothetical protein